MYGPMNPYAQDVFYNRKLQLEGTKYHTIYCGESGTIHSWNIFEERDHPIAMCRAEFNTSSNLKTGGLFF